MAIDDWFNNKYQKGDKITLDDKIRLLKSHRITVPDRAVEDLVKKCTYHIHLLKQEYTPENHVLAYHYLCSVASLNKVEDRILNDCLDTYKKALAKHDNLALHTNFG
jgi:hypothetical protein